MTKTVGCRNEFGRIGSLLLKHPRQAYKDEVSIRNQWRTLGYPACPDFDKAAEEYETFVTLLRQQISEVAFLPVNEETGLDSIYVRDSSVMTGKGVILARMGKAERSGEVQAVRDYYSGSGIPIIGAITGEGRLEGGDVVLWDKKTIIVGQGYRTNAEGIRQLREFVAKDIEDCVIVPLPHWEGPKGVMHLMSLISPIDSDLAVVYSRLLPVPFRNWLLERSVELVEVPDAEFSSLGCNVLAVAPRKCLMAEGNPVTRQLLLDRGAEVWEYRGAEISLKGAGGPTCLTRPLRRSG
jgi:arginine deiminase